MTEPRAGASPQWESETPATLLDRRVDIFLAQLVHTVELAASIDKGTDVRVPVTVIVGGATVSGDVTAGRFWWAKFEEVVRAAEPGPSATAESATALGKLLGDAYHRLWPAVYEQQPDLSQADSLHLTDAHVIHARGSVPSPGGLLMRLKLGEVQGWSLGKLEEGLSEE
jgi:hypothetical protein